MTRSSFFIFFIIIINFIFSRTVFAAQNNRFGVHILFPEEVKTAAELVNSSGGDWGYVVIPIQSIDRNREKWQAFMDDCKQYHLIPVIRLATYPNGSSWTKPTEWDSVDFANFLNDLNWPTKKKIIAVYNEPNHSAEWGGEVNPWEYAEFLSDTIDQFKKRDKNFVMLNAGLDASAPSAKQNSLETMDEYEFMSNMVADDPNIFRKIDGFNSHSYPNPAFSALPDSYTRFGIRSYQHELNFLQNNYGIYGLPVYVTETGWRKSDYLTNEKIAQFYQTAYREVWVNEYLRVVAAFILRADAGPFEAFSILENAEKKIIYNSIVALKKEGGKPELNTIKIEKNNDKIIKSQSFQEQAKIEFIKFKSWWKKIFRWALRN